MPCSLISESDLELSCNKGKEAKSGNRLPRMSAEVPAITLYNWVQRLLVNNPNLQESCLTSYICSKRKTGI